MPNKTLLIAILMLASGYFAEKTVGAATELTSKVKIKMHVIPYTQIPVGLDHSVDESFTYFALPIID